jgi:crotonobetainyl-CoA:carnitine CoA-transferase CaiB-like acyl-CoA transferase
MFATNKRSFWIKLMRESRLVAAPVNSMIEASNDPDIIANNYVSEIFHPELGENIKIHGTPWKFSETPSKFGLAPRLGEHNHEILKSIGFNKNEIYQFETDEII